MSAKFVDALLATLPGTVVSTDADLINRACMDWRKRYQSTALAVVSPTSVEQVRTLVRLCKAHDVAITTQGGNTGLVGGSVPMAASGEKTRPEVVLRTSRLREVLSLDESNLSLTASAGYTLSEVQEYAAAQGYLFPLSLASEGSCTLGGNLASNAGGVAVLRYGNARELCLGVEYVNAEGELCGDLRGLRKNNTGYDLRHLLIGSEGTLGVITTACMKVFPAPRSKVVAWLNVRDINSAVDCLKSLQQRLLHALSSFEWMNAEAIDLVQAQFSLKAPQGPSGCDHVLAEFTSAAPQATLDAEVQEALEALTEQVNGLYNVTLARNQREQGQLWALRENISEAQAKTGLNIKHDVACAVSRLPDFHGMALAAIAEEGIEVRPVLFGHLGDGNLHFNLSAPAGADPASFLASHQSHLNDLVHGAIVACGGTVSAEHGIGQLKAELLREITPGANYQAMLAIKAALDPAGLFNPGKLLVR